MRAEIQQVRHELLAWGKNQPQATWHRVRIICANLAALSIEPTDEPLRRQTAANVADLSETMKLRAEHRQGVGQ